MGCKLKGEEAHQRMNTGTHIMKTGIFYNQNTSHQMEISFSSPAGGEIEIIRNIQEAQLPFKLPFSATDLVKGTFGKMFFHHVSLPIADIWSNVYDIREPVTLTGRGSMSLTEIHGSMQGHIQTCWNGVEQSIQHLHQYNLSHTETVDNTVHFPASQLYRTLDMHVKLPLLEEYASVYPLLYEFVNKVHRKEACSLTDNDFILTEDMRNCLERIADYCSTPAAARFFYDAKIKEFLVLMMDQVTLNHKKRRVAPVFPPRQKDAVIAARDLLVADFSKRPPTIRELRKKVGSNECVLKKSFKHYFHMPIHQYYIAEKMRKAKDLLKDPSHNVTEVGRLLGYQDAQNFCNDFKKHFRQAPGKWAQENRGSGRLWVRDGGCDDLEI
jgi:AraC-like DNA-binding protein